MYSTLRFPRLPHEWKRLRGHAYNRIIHQSTVINAQLSSVSTLRLMIMYRPYRDRGKQGKIQYNGVVRSKFYMLFVSSGHHRCATD